MADKHMPLDIGAQDIIQFQEYKCSAYLDLEKKKSHFPWHKHCQRYFIISKGAKNNNWILFCFSHHHSTRAEWAYSMLQMESVRKYDKRDVVGFRIVFIEANMPEIILICDTEENRENWMSSIQEAIIETHSFSKDSGFESGGSIAGLQRDAIRHCCSGFNNYDTIDDDCINKTQDHKNDEKQKKRDLGVENSEETILKLPTPVEATSACLNKTISSEELPKDKSMKGNSGEMTIHKSFEEKPTLYDTEGAMTLSLSKRSVSFCSVVDASDPSLAATSTSYLQVSCGTADTSVNCRDYQNIEYRIHKSSSNDRNSCSSCGSDTTSYEKPARFGQVVKPDEYFYEGRQNPKGLLRDTPEGTFLIFRKGHGLRLHVKTQRGVKYLRLFEQNGNVSFYKDLSSSPDSVVFSSLDNFLKHYSVHCIPKEEYSVRLTQGYRNVIKESAE